MEYIDHMDALFDMKDESIRRSLGETIAWCGRQHIIASVDEPEEIRRRRHLGRQGSELIRRAYIERDRFWNRLLRRSYTDDRLWRQGSELLRQADLSSIAPLQDQLCSPALRPSKSLSQLRNNQDRHELVSSIILRRSELVRAEETAHDHNLGRFILYVPEENLADGAAKYSSNGFFDIDNVPPWDTWVAFSHNTLLSWVPPELVGLAQSGIDVNPENCIRWMN